MESIILKKLGDFEKVLNYDKSLYSVYEKEKLHNKQIVYEAINQKTGMKITCYNQGIFNSHFKKAVGA